MNVTLINLFPKPSHTNYFSYNHGLGYIASSLKRAGHQVRLLSISSADRNSSGQIEDLKSDLIFLYLSTNQYPLFLSLLDSLRKSRIPLFLGGPHPTVCPEETLNVEGVKGVCIGEGEETAIMIADRYKESLKGIPNLWYREENGMHKNQTGLWAQNLNGLPFPDRSIFPYEKMLKTDNFRTVGFEFMASRGCPYSCRYCINPFLNRMGNPVRKRSADNVLEEIKQVVTKYGYNGVIGFHDDIFPLDRRWLKEFSVRYPARVGLPFWCNSRIDTLQKDAIGLLKKAGCFRIHVGVECGNEEIRKSVLEKDITNQEVMEKINLIKTFGIKVVASFMIGLPEEKEEDVLETIRLCRAIRPAWILRSIFCPYPGTQIYDDLVRQGTIQPDFYANLSTDSFYSSTPTFIHPHLSREKLKHYFDDFIKLSYS